MKNPDNWIELRLNNTKNETQSLPCHGHPIFGIDITSFKKDIILVYEDEFIFVSHFMTSTSAGLV